jgi:Fe-Mn family superoxide dismutase
LFGSGWVWLIAEHGSLKVTTTSDAETPLVSGQLPLLAIDVWEHAYYLDYASHRANYITVFLEYLVHWDFVAETLAKG